MTIKLFDEMGGVITLRLSGSNLERFMNIASTRGIYIWDLKWRDDGVYLRVRSSAYKALQNIAAENGYELEIISKKGLPFYKSMIKRRLGLLGGALLFILSLYFVSSFIWFIEVSGNQKIAAPEIISSAAHNGIYVGAAKWRFSTNAVEKAMLRDLARLAYVQCEIQGVKVRIKVVEKILPDDEITGPCHVVAAKDGVVEDILVLDGQANVKIGQVVGKGDILISGIVYPPVPYTMEEGGPPPNLEPYPVRARGTVKARTWYEGYGECPLKVESKVFTGRQKTSVYLLTPWKKLCLKKSRHDFALYRTEKRDTTLTSRLGKWGLCKRIVREQKITAKNYSEEEAIRLARARGLKNLRRQLQPEWKISDSQVNILSSPSDSIARIKIAVECIEDISRSQAINVGEISN